MTENDPGTREGERTVSGDSRRTGLSTTGIHGGAEPAVPGAPVVPSIVQSATFFGSGAGDTELLYTRYGNNPTQLALGRKVAALEGTEASLPFGSGMGAIAATILALAEAGDHVVASRFLYGATKVLLETELPRRGVETTFVDPLSSDAWAEAIRPNTRVLYLELPTNPTLRVFDPRLPAALARARGIPLVADVTFASPVNFRGAEWGIDAVIHSATKYLGGHSDLIAGVVSGSSALMERIRGMLKLYGAAIDPHAAWLLDRGIRTLSVRMERHNRNGMELARWFAERPEVAAVVYPGLPDHPDHALATELLDGYGGMVGVVLHDGAAADAFCGALELARLAPSLGGVETLVSQPRYTSHVAQSPGEREALGIPDGFVRISLGIEDADDLKRDFERGLAAGSGAGS
jgi:cystathionine beta-lyase/cystathionine gamma-synthase